MTWPRAWAHDLALGARMALAGGLSGWVRAALTAVGVGLGVAMLLVAASAPNAITARDTRQANRDTVSFDAPPPASDTTMLVAYTMTDFRDRTVRGILLDPDGTRPPLPPGLAAIPAPGQMAVSPALGRLLAAPDGALLRERLCGSRPCPVGATIGDAGLVDPAELVFYLGADDLDETDANVVRRDSFAEPPWRDGPDPVLSMIIVVIVVVLLLPVGLFVAAAIRFGGEARDRRLASVRLLGADAGMARRIAAGEALTGAALGLLVGAALFAAVRSVVDRVELGGFAAFPSDLRPDPGLAALLAVGVPAAAVLVTLVSMRRVVIEPLGVTRRTTGRRRRLWWRLLVPAAGVALLLPLVGALRRADSSASEEQVAAGVILVLVGVAVLLPWAVEAAVHRLRGGSVAWQLAVRRLQLDPSTAARAVMGIAVAVAGAVGLQTVFTSVQGNYVRDAGLDGADAFAFFHARGWGEVHSAQGAMLREPGVEEVVSRLPLSGTFVPAPGSPGAWLGETYTRVVVADCPSIQVMVVADSCADGDVFVTEPIEAMDFTPVPGPGDVVRLEARPGGPAGGEWTVPDDTRTVAGRDSFFGSAAGVYATPSAVPDELVAAQRHYVDARITLDDADADAIERIRNVLWRLDRFSGVHPRQTNIDELATTRQALFAGAVLTLALIGVSLLVGMLEQLRERRRVLASLVAFGTRRRTLAWSMLWQAAVPIGLGLALAVAAGTGVGALLLRIAGVPLRVDWVSTGLVAGAATLLVLAMTSMSIPVLWRLMRADGLRTE